MYVNIPRNENFDYLNFDGDQSFITRREKYRVNYDILERLKMVKYLTYIWIECKNNKSLVQCIDILTMETVHNIAEISKLRTYILSLISIWLFKNN